MKKQELNVNEIYTINGVNYRLNEDLKLIELTKSIYDLQDGDKYYFVSSNSGVSIDSWEDWNFDKYRLELGNVFLTEEEAQFELERRKTIAEIKRWKYKNDNDYKFICDKQNYFIGFNVKQNQFKIDAFCIHIDRPNYLYFSSKEKAFECLEFIGEENWKKYVLEIE